MPTQIITGVVTAIRPIEGGKKDRGRKAHLIGAAKALAVIRLVIRRDHLHLLLLHVVVVVCITLRIPLYLFCPCAIRGPLAF